MIEGFVRVEPTEAMANAARITGNAADQARGKEVGKGTVDCQAVEDSNRITLTIGAYGWLPIDGVPTQCVVTDSGNEIEREWWHDLTAYCLVFPGDSAE